MHILIIPVTVPYEWKAWAGVIHSVDVKKDSHMHNCNWNIFTKNWKPSNLIKASNLKQHENSTCNLYIKDTVTQFQQHVLTIDKFFNCVMLEIETAIFREIYTQRNFGCWYVKLYCPIKIHPDPAINHYCNFCEYWNKQNWNNTTRAGVTGYHQFRH